jgi:glutaminyl-tRNA synthetase
MGVRRIPFGRELWIEADDFMENAPADYFRLSLGKSGAPGNPVRLRFAYVVRATSVEKDATGNITAVHAEYLPETRSGSPGQNSVKTKTAIHWLPVSAAVAAEVRLYDRLFTEAQPDASERNFLDLLNADSKTVLTSFVEASLASARPDDKFQFERNGYFVADRKDHTAEGPVFNLAVSLRDSFAK